MGRDERGRPRLQHHGPEGIAGPGARRAASAGWRHLVTQERIRQALALIEAFPCDPCVQAPPPSPCPD
ncbi:MAG: hypothetical protein MZU84_08315 [Sphingobacterium sp.]|nr:hypothetical protein [Sphingobacterium sp.]